MKKKVSKEVSKVAQSLKLILRNGDYVTTEALAERLRVSRVTVQRAFAILQRSPGWSFRASNSKAYWRRYRYGNINRGRKKGDPYHHDFAESDWERTHYLIRRPDPGVSP